MRRALITGASGFIGSHIARAFAERGFEVTATGRSAARLQQHEHYARCAPLDLAADDLAGLTNGIDTIVHCAALSSPWGRLREFRRANVEATRRLLEAAERSGVRRFVHISSPSIYFRLAHQFNVEEHFRASKAINAYAQTKWEAEQVVAASQARGLSTIVLRPRAVFGEEDTTIMPRVLRIARRGAFPLFGDGRAQIDTTYVGNVVDAAWRAAHAPDTLPTRCFNITDGAPMSVRDLLEGIFRALDWRVRLVRVPTPVALAAAGVAEFLARITPMQPEPRLTRYGVGVLAYSQTLDISAARQHLGYRPAFTTTQGIARYAQWYARHAAH